METSSLPTSPAEEAAIAERIEAIGGVTGGMCTVAVSSALNGTCGLGNYWLPSSLAQAAREAAKKDKCEGGK